MTQTSCEEEKEFRAVEVGRRNRGEVGHSAFAVAAPAGSRRSHVGVATGQDRG